MTDLTEALREAGHDDIADQLEKKALANELRKAGRDDLADALEAGRRPQAQQPQPRDLAQYLLDQINSAKSPEFTEIGTKLPRAGFFLSLSRAG